MIDDGRIDAPGVSVTLPSPRKLLLLPLLSGGSVEVARSRRGRGARAERRGGGSGSGVRRARAGVGLSLGLGVCWEGVVGDEFVLGGVGGGWRCVGWGEGGLGTFWETWARSGYVFFEAWSGVGNALEFMDEVWERFCGRGWGLGAVWKAWVRSGYVFGGVVGGLIT